MPRAARRAGPPTLFLLSPARCSTERAVRLIDGRGTSEIAQQLCSPAGAPLGEVFAFLSSLYFRGKLAYARSFVRPAHEPVGVFVITPGEGLRVESEPITAARMRAFGQVEVHHANDRFAAPLLRDARVLAARTSDDTRFVLLGSIASAKYVAPLQQALGPRLVFPAEFVGRGDMSRGGLLLRATQDNHELDYVPVLGATLHGPRPPRLAPRKRTA
jgi:hypothetical protein